MYEWKYLSCNWPLFLFIISSFLLNSSFTHSCHFTRDVNKYHYCIQCNEMTSCKSIFSWQSMIILWCVSQSRDVSQDWRALNFFLNVSTVRCFGSDPVADIHIQSLIICEFKKTQLYDFLSKNPVRARAPQLAVLTSHWQLQLGHFMTIHYKHLNATVLDRFGHSCH